MSRNEEKSKLKATVILQRDVKIERMAKELEHRPGEEVAPENADQRQLLDCYSCHAKSPPSTRLSHMMKCRKFRRLEPKRSCPTCKMAMPKFLSYVHQNRCEIGRRRLYRCTICSKETRNSQALFYHLSHHCLRDYLLTTCKSLTGELQDQSETDEVKAEPDETIKDEEMEKQEYDDFVIETIFTLPDEDTETEKESVSADKVCQNKNKAETKESNNNTESSVSVIELVADDTVECPFCPESVTSVKELKTNHVIYCNGLKKFEPMKTCQFCNADLPTSLHGLHLLVCKQNPAQLPWTVHNLKNIDIRCPKCGVVGRIKFIVDHMARCYQHLKLQMENALTNKDLNWKSNENGRDYIQESGLSIWLK